MLWVGGGIFPPVIGIIGGVVGTRINTPLKKQPGPVWRMLAKAWPWTIVVFFVWLFGQSVIGYFFIGHAMAFVPALGLFSTENWHHRSWLLTGIVGHPASRVISIVLFGIVLIGFVGAGLGVFGWLVPNEWWRTLAIASAVISLVALALFWNSFAALFPNKIGAMGVNIATLVCLLWANWPMEAALGY